ncbi:MAG: Rieske (2Fe-2S) protein [Candidatus Dormibacteria bacterium]
MDARPPGVDDGDLKTGRAATRKPTARKAAARKRAARSVAPDVYLYRLISRTELGRRGVAAVETPLGRFAVGIAKGTPFAVSDTCRHLFASLGEGRITREGCLQCPWHRSRYDVTTGRMVRGPQGLLFLSVREITRAYTNLLFPLRVLPVIEHDGVLYLETAGLEA